jgi:hypothetical protein
LKLLIAISFAAWVFLTLAVVVGRRKTYNSIKGELKTSVLNFRMHF